MKTEKVEYLCSNCGEILRRKPTELPPHICNYCHHPMSPEIIEKRNKEVEKRFKQQNKGKSKTAIEEVRN